MKRPIQPLDEFDRQILALLQHDNLMPQRQIGERVHLSAAAVQRRIKRLTDDGYILANRAVLNAEKLGFAITVFVEVELISETAPDIDRMKALFAAAPQIQQCAYVTGEADFMLVILVESMAAYEALTRQLFFDSGNVRKFRSFVVMDRVKQTTELPIAP